MAHKDTKDMPAPSPDHPVWPSAITSVQPGHMLVRGYPIEELMGRVPFGHAIFLLVTGELPTRDLGQIIDALLVGFIDHGATSPATRATREAVGRAASTHSAVAAGVVDVARHHGAPFEASRALLEEGLDRAGSSMLFGSAAADLAEHLVATDRIPPPGFALRDQPADPRAARLLEIAHDVDAGHIYVQFLRALEQALARHPALEELPMVVTIEGAISAICGDMGLAPDIADAMLLIARVPGLTAHALEARYRPAPTAPPPAGTNAYDGPPERRLKDRR